MRPAALRIAVFLAALAFALPGRASFHLFAIDEIFSSADGKVQFVELAALAGGQQFVADHTITARSGSSSHSFTLTADLPGDTSGRKFLIGTQSFAALGVVAPDVVVPDNFFFIPSGTVDWAGADVWNYGGVPADGNLSLNRDGSTSPNSPTNFAGATGHVTLTAGPPPPPPPTTSYEGLWWRSPAGSESGWGVNITHQGEILFATWFTYDSDGSGMWLVAPSTTWVRDGLYQGALYRTTGPSFDAVPWDGSSVQVTQVGAVTFNFTDDNNGTFSYNVNGVTQTKNITRQVYSATTYSCFVGGTAGTTPVYQDLWWRSPAGIESGWGVNIAHQGDILFVTWFTYDKDRKGLWIVGPNVAKVDTNVYAGALYRTTGPAFSAVPWNPSSVVVSPVGTVTISFSDANNGTFSYTLNGVSQSKTITRQVYSSPQTVCR